MWKVLSCHSSHTDILTHWGRVTHICIAKLTIIGSDNGLSPERRQAIIWTNAGILLIGHLRTNSSEILSEIHTFWFKKMHLKMSFGKWQPFCLGLNVLSLMPWLCDCWAVCNIISGFSARLQYLQCISNGDTAVLLWAIDIILNHGTARLSYQYRHISIFPAPKPLPCIKQQLPDVRSQSVPFQNFVLTARLPCLHHMQSSLHWII